ncbi:hypothetical protein DV737_g2951, partial [Chaetothyriales sp. CBS 132003]
MSETIKAVSIPNIAWETAADIHFPPNFDENKKYPAVVSAHPIGSCKEQTSGNIYGKALAEAGLVVVAFDASFQGASGGKPRFIEDPGFRVSDFRFVVDYIQTLPYVDPERIGVLGICGGGGYAFNAAMTDYRFKCCVGITPVNFGRVARESLANFDPAGSLEKMAKQRTLEAQGADRFVFNYLPETVAEAKKTTSDPDVVQATEYYKTDRGKAPCGCTSGLFSFNSAALTWDAFNHAEVLMTRPFIAVIGDIPGFFGAYRDASEIHARAASKEKQLLVLPGVSHYMLYDDPKAVKPALDQVLPFLKKHLGEAELCQIIAAAAVIVYYATPLRNAASEHKYTDGKFVYATAVGSASLATALSVLIIPPRKQIRAIPLLFVLEWILVILWLALFLLFRAFFHENAEMDSGIEKMKIAVYFDVASFILCLNVISRNVAPRSQLLYAVRSVSTSDKRPNKDDPYHKSSTAATGTSAGPHEGSASRTNNQIIVEYPDESEFPKEPPMQGRGVHFKRTLPSFSLEGRTVVITGGARGLGLVMGQACVNSGADLAIVDLNIEEEGERQAQELVKSFEKDNPGSEQYDRAKFGDGKKLGVFRTPKITAHYADVANPDSVTSCVADILQTHGKIDHLVTSAGFTENFAAEHYPYDRMKKLWSVNVDGTYLFCTAVASHLMERKAPGSIVLIGSMSGAVVNVPQPQAPYNAAKAAIRHLAASLAVEWAHAHIRVNCISPGYMLTALTRKILDDNPELNQKWTSLIPVGKIGRPEDLMGAVTFLLSDASGYVTGADLRVDGGYTCT